MPKQASPTPSPTSFLGKWCISDVCTCRAALHVCVSAIAERNSRRVHLLNGICLVHV